MNRCLGYELQTHSPRGRVEEHPAYIVALACLLLGWAIFSVATAILLAALFLPGHLGLMDLLKELGNLVPADAPMYTT
jgi:hypothetical protein